MKKRMKASMKQDRAIQKARAAARAEADEKYRVRAEIMARTVLARISEERARARTRTMIAAQARVAKKAAVKLILQRRAVKHAARAAVAQASMDRMWDAMFTPFFG